MLGRVVLAPLAPKRLVRQEIDAIIAIMGARTGKDTQARLAKGRQVVVHRDPVALIHVEEIVGVIIRAELKVAGRAFGVFGLVQFEAQFGIDQGSFVGAKLDVGPAAALIRVAVISAYLNISEWDRINTQARARRPVRRRG